MVRRLFILFAILAPALVLLLMQWWPGAVHLFWIIGPLILIGVIDMTQRRHTIRRIYPVIGNLRYLMESIRPEVQQYFVESDTNGMPFNREFRSLVYQRAKGVRDTRAFGTIFETYRPGYEWMNPTLMPKRPPVHEPRVRFGSVACRLPYEASHLNISALSYGALSRTAILALNKGARMGNFAHNTGEGGISCWHREHGGDLIWQIGTGYFGCRMKDGRFDPVQFTEQAREPQVKMIELKLSQGAKPGHGGFLPGVKVTEEIAEIRGVPVGEDVVSPPYHTTFASPIGLLEFIAQLRELSGGKPVGFKLCVGHRIEVLAIGKAMLESGIVPDFITVDGGEGGTGAAPIELTNSVGMPMRDGLMLVHNMLVGIGLRDQVRVIAAGKVASGFHMARLLALGADTVNAARAFMFALGCIQARECNANTCPTGVATQDPSRWRQLDVEDKAMRVMRYHEATIHALLELVGSAGLTSPDEIRPCHIMRRIDGTDIRSYAELYPWLENGCLLEPGCVPEAWKSDWQAADPSRWVH